ncbi:MAG: cytochrome P450 [Caulobacterales bacterium]
MGEGMKASGSLLDPAIQKCPYPFFDAVRAQEGVYKDPKTGFYVVTRYDDARRVLSDPALFSSAGYIKHVKSFQSEERNARVRKTFEEKGWVPGGSVSWLDDPEHEAVRSLFDKAFRAGKITEMDPAIEATVRTIISRFAERRKFDAMADFGVPIPLTIIMRQMGAGEQDMMVIKHWLDSWTIRMGMMLNEEEEIQSVLEEIEAQHYFKPIIDRMRAEPDGSVLSDLINTPMPDGSTLSDNDILGLIMSDTFVAGSETTRNALAIGVLQLCRDPHVQETLRADPDRYIPVFIEEVLRLEAPVQMAARIAQRDTEIGGFPIPAGAVIDVRFGAANRDSNKFSCPEKLDLHRPKAGAHLTFGSGIHHCMGAPLARREMHWAFKVLLETTRNLRLAPGQPEPGYDAHYMALMIRPFEVEFDIP